MTADFHLQRFVDAQDSGGTYRRAVTELRAGHKAGHWMWFVFPQLAGLGTSPTSRLYAITGLAEARAYLAHPVLGPRLRECALIVARLESVDATEVFGGIDAQKLCSSMTLFRRAAAEEQTFQHVLDRYFAGAADPATDRLLHS